MCGVENIVYTDPAIQTRSDLERVLDEHPVYVHGKRAGEFWNNGVAVLELEREAVRVRLNAGGIVEVL